MENNINNIISKMLLVNKNIETNDINKIIIDFKKAIEINKDLIEKTNILDKVDSNSFIIDTNIIYNIFSNLEKEKLSYGTITLSSKNDEIIYGKEIFDIGNVVTITDGNPYVLIEMIIRNLMAFNTVLFVNNGNMQNTNRLIIDILKTVLKQNNFSKNLVELYISENYDDILSNFANIDLVICIGDHYLQNLILSKSKNKTIVSGYENFDLYIEDTKNIDFINKIINSGIKINLYIKDELDFDNDNSIRVNDIEEAITQINYNGNRYSTGIFTSSSDNASKFIKEVKSSIITVNASPSIERIIDIKQCDLIKEKTIIYPNNFKITDSVEEKIN